MLKTCFLDNKRDFTYLQWSKVQKTSGVAGSFLKAYSELGGRKTYYKLSNYDTKTGVVGHECVNEIIADRLLNFLGIEHLHYQLIYADISLNDKVESVYLCASEDFKNPGEDKIALDEFYEIEHLPGENELSFCIRQGWEDYIYKMIIVDFLILNRDRHGANIEVLRDKKTKSIRLAPLFDHGLSLLFSCRTDTDVDSFDVLKDRPVQSYVGSYSAHANLELIPPDKMPKLDVLHKEDKTRVLAGLESVVSPKLLEKIWDMIWKRWCYLEDFRNSR